MVLGTIAGVGNVGATVPSVDTSASDATTTTSQLQDNTVLSNVSGVGNDTFTLQTNVTPDDTVEMKLQVNGSDTIVFRNTSAENVSAAGTSNSGAHYNLSVDEEDIDDIERTLDENVTVDVTVYDADNETDPGDAASAGNGTTIQVHMNFTDGRTVQNIDDVDADPDTDDAPVETEELSNEIFDTTIAIGGIQATDFSTLDVDDRDIDGENSEVVLVFSNDTVADDAANAVASDADDGDPLYAMPIQLQGDETTRWIRVYNEEPSDDVDDDDDGDTYGVYKEAGVGGEDGVVIHLGEAYEDDDEVAVVGTLNAGSFTTRWHQIRTSSIGQSLFGLVNLGGLSLDGGEVPLVVSTGLVVAATRRRPPRGPEPTTGAGSDPSVTVTPGASPQTALAG